MFRDILEIVKNLFGFLRNVSEQEKKKKQKKLNVPGSVWDKPIPPPPRPPRPNPFPPED